VAHGRSCFALAIAHGVFCDSAACLLVDAAVIVDCVLLMVWFAPLLASLNAHLGVLDGDAGRRFPTTTQG
jgi:hypothetical protein